MKNLGTWMNVTESKAKTYFEIKEKSKFTAHKNTAKKVGNG